MHPTARFPVPGISALIMIDQGWGLFNTLTISIKKGQKYNGSPECATDLL